MDLIASGIGGGVICAFWIWVVIQLNMISKNRPLNLQLIVVTPRVRGGGYSFKAAFQISRADYLYRHLLEDECCITKPIRCSIYWQNTNILYKEDTGSFTYSTINDLLKILNYVEYPALYAYLNELKNLGCIGLVIVDWFND